jgi:phage terminase small subunit
MSGLNDKQRKFCELVVAGRPAGRAYQEAGYMVRSDAVADQSASRMLRNVKVVKDHLFELREKAAEAAAMTHAEMVAFLSNVIRTPIGQVDENNPLCQEWVKEEIDEAAVAEDDGEQPDLFGGEAMVTTKRIKDGVPVNRVRIKMVGKMDAAKTLIGVMGWNKPQKVELGADEQLSELISIIRKTA